MQTCHGTDHLCSSSRFYNFPKVHIALSDQFPFNASEGKVPLSKCFRAVTITNNQNIKNILDATNKLIINTI